MSFDVLGLRLFFLSLRLILFSVEKILSPSLTGVLLFLLQEISLESGDHYIIEACFTNFSKFLVLRFTEH